MKMHSGEKPNDCKMCDYASSDAGSLRKHLKTHSGENTNKYNQCDYDAVSDVVESRVHQRSDFQIGSRVLKICFKPILMHIYGMQYDFMHRSC